MTVETRFEFGPRARRGYAGMSPSQVTVLLVGVLAALAVLNLVGGIVGLPLAVGVAAVGGLLTFTRHAGLALPQWAPVIFQRMLGERRWTHAGPVDGATHLPAWPKALGNVTSRDDGGGYLYDGAPVGLLDVTAPAAFTLASSFSRSAATAGLAATLAGLAEPGGLVEAISWTVRVGPADPDALDAWATAHTSGTAHPGLAASYADLLGEAGPSGQAHTHTLAIRLRQSGREVGYARRFAGGVGPLVARETERLAGQLGDAGVKATPLTTAARGRVVSHLDLFGAPPAPMLGFRDEWDLARVDGSLFRVLWVEDMPRVPVAADFLAPLLVACRAPRIVTLIARPVPADAAVSTAERQAGGQEADAELLARHGVRLSAARRRALGASQVREAELTAGHALIRYTALVAVSALDRSQLEDATAEVIAAGAKARLRLRVLYGRQGPALAAVLPLARKVTR